MDLLQTHPLRCPYCGEAIEIIVDCSVPQQEYIEDCQVCCRPINIRINLQGEKVEIYALHENE